MMNKKNFFRMMAVAAVASVAIASCDKSAPKMDEKSAEQQAPVELKIAFVEVDSIMTQYAFCKDYTQILQKKGQNIQNTLAAKQRSLEQAAANFQQKLQQNAYTREQAEGIQASLQKQAADLDVLNQRLSNEFQTETDKYNNALRDSIQHFLARYNKDKKYSLILSKAGDNLLYADKAFDITAEVIAGLNKAYKPAAKADAERLQQEQAEVTPAAEEQPAIPAVVEDTPAEQPAEKKTPILPWVAGGVVLLGLIGFLLARRKSSVVKPSDMADEVSLLRGFLTSANRERTEEVEDSAKK